MHQWRQQELLIKYNGWLTASDQDSTLCLTPADEDMDLYLSNEVKFYAGAMIQLRKVWSCPYFDSTDILGFCRIWFIQFIVLNILFRPGFNKKKPILQFFSHSIDSKPHHNCQNKVSMSTVQTVRRKVAFNCPAFVSSGSFCLFHVLSSL